MHENNAAIRRGNISAKKQRAIQLAELKPFIMKFYSARPRVRGTRPPAGGGYRDSMSEDAVTSEDLVRRAREVLPGIRADLEDLVRIQSVSADPARAGEVQRSADRAPARCCNPARVG